MTVSGVNVLLRVMYDEGGVGIKKLREDKLQVYPPLSFHPRLALMFFHRYAVERQHDNDIR